MVWWLGLLTLVAGACANGDSTDTTAGSSVDGVATSDAAQAVDEAFRAVPDGYADCGSVNLSSGWPTTTAFFSEVRGLCMAEAADSGERSQQSFHARDNQGGRHGAILRVNGPGDIVMIDYRVDGQGIIASTETTCSRLDTPATGPPTCADS